MNLNAKKKLLHTLIALVDARRRNYQGIENFVEPIGIKEYINKVSTGTSDNYAEIYKQLLQNEAWSKKFSGKYFKTHLENLIIKLVREGSDKAEKYLDLFIKEYEDYNKEQVVYIPLSGITFDVDEIPIGRIVLSKITDTHFDSLLKQVEDILDNIKNSLETREMLKQHTSLQLQALKGKICAKFRVIAEPTRARELAEQETRRVFDVLNYGLPSLYSKDLHVTIGFAGEVNTNTLTIPILSSDGESYNPQSRVTGSLCHFELIEPNIKILQEIGVFTLATILAKPDNQITHFEQVLLRAVHWYATSETQDELENRLLNLIICLETFLTPKENNPITTAVAEGVALILGKTLDIRKIIKKKVKDWYGMRSGVAHGGNKSVLETDCDELSDVARSVIYEMIKQKDKFKTQKDLLDWIEDQKLS
jgi:Apea-like HEPN